jgi:hypothetical protein
MNNWMLVTLLNNELWNIEMDLNGLVGGVELKLNGLRVSFGATKFQLKLDKFQNKKNCVLC